MTASAEFLDQTIERFGEEQAETIVGTVLREVEFAQNYHDLVWPYRTVGVGYSNWDDIVEGVPISPVIGQTDGYFGFKIMFKETALDDDTLSLIRSVVVHETTHTAQTQYAWKSGEVNDNTTENPWTMLRYAFNEGVAFRHELQFINEAQLQNPALNPRMLGSIDRIKSEVEALIDDTNTSFATGALSRFLLGDEKTPKMGYRIGLQIVDFCIDNELVALSDLVKLRTDEIYELTHAFVKEVADEEAA